MTSAAIQQEMFSWYFNGNEIELQTTTSLNLYPLELEQFGLYTCMVTNYFADAEHVAYFDTLLTRIGPPDSPQDLTITESTSVSLTLTWKPPSFDGGLNDLSYKLWFEIDGAIIIETDISGTLNTYTITSLQSETTYGFHLAAVNSFRGISTSQAASVVGTSKGSIY